MEIVNECQREIDSISSVYNTAKICQDLQFLSLYYINHAKRPGRDRNIPSVLQECIVDTHLPSDESGNDSLHDASSRLRQVVVELKDMLLAEFNTRFTDNNVELWTSMEALNPKSKTFLEPFILKPFYMITPRRFQMLVESC